MGQYFEIQNWDKAESFAADAFCQNIKRGGLTAGFQRDALMLLLTTSRENHPLAGHWIGDRIAVVGDNSSLSDEQEDKGTEFKDIGPQVREMIKALDPVRMGRMD